jgi:hypothetical protein
MKELIINICIRILESLSDGWSMSYSDFEDAYENPPKILKKECVRNNNFIFIPKDIQKKYKKEIKDFFNEE